MAESFTREESGNIVIDGITIPKNVFLSLEPSYIEVDNLSFLQYTKGGPRRIVANGKQYSIDGVWDNGERYLSRLQDYVTAVSYVNADFAKTENDIVEMVEKANTPRARRKKDYPPLEDLVVALWENLIEKKSKKNSGIDQIQKLRKAIKAKYPTENQDAVSTDEEETN